MPPANASKSPSLLAVVCLLGVGLGVLAVVAGIAWNFLVGDSLVYSEAQAKEYSEAVASAHAATSGHDHSSATPTSEGAAVDREAAVAAARQRFNKAEKALQSARFAKNELGKWIVVGGLAMTVVFGIGYGACRGGGK